MRTIRYQEGKEEELRSLTETTFGRGLEKITADPFETPGNFELYVQYTGAGTQDESKKEILIIPRTKRISVSTENIPIRLLCMNSRILRIIPEYTTKKESKDLTYHISLNPESVR